MRVLLFLQWFTPEPDLKGLPFAKELVKLGHEVQVLTGFPNYPGGKVYPGYKIKLFQKEIIDNIEILRVPLYPSHNKSSLGRILNYLSFAFFATLIGPFVIKKADVMYVYQPPATISLPAIILKFFRRIPIVYDIQDLWPDTLNATGMFNSKFGIKIIDIYLRAVYKYINKIIVLSPGFKKKLVDRGVPEEKINVIYNWSNEIKYSDRNEIVKIREIFQFENKFIVMFAGNMGNAQGLCTILKTAKLLQVIEKKIHFVFVGDGIIYNSLIAQVKEMELKNVEFIKRVATADVGKYLSSADVLLVHLKKNELFKITIPSKTQAYMMVGKPIIMAVNGDASDLIKKAGAGLICEPDNPDEISSKILELFNMLESERIQIGNNGRNYYEKHLSIEMGTKAILVVFNEVAFN